MPFIAGCRGHLQSLVDASSGCSRTFQMRKRKGRGKVVVGVQPCLATASGHACQTDGAPPQRGVVVAAAVAVVVDVAVEAAAVG